MIKKYDFFIIGFIILLAMTSFFVFNYFIWNDSYAKYAVVMVDSEEYARYNLEEIKDEKTVEIKTEFGINTIEITKKGVRVIEASCPDKLDVKKGEISKANQMIVCVPNRLSIRLVGGEVKVDKVSY